MDVPIQDVRASGVGGKSKLWRQMQADIFGFYISINTSAGSALGAPFLQCWVGIYENVNEACAATIEKVDRAEPIGDNS